MHHVISENKAGRAFIYREKLKNIVDSEHEKYKKKVKKYFDNISVIDQAFVRCSCRKCKKEFNIEFDDWMEMNKTEILCNNCELKKFREVKKKLNNIMKTYKISFNELTNIHYDTNRKYEE